MTRPAASLAVLLFTLFLLAPFALADLQRVAVDVHANGVVEERVTLLLNVSDSFSSVSYTLPEAPLAVITQERYTLNGTQLTIEHALAPGENAVAFTLLFDALVEQRGALHALATSFEPTGTLAVSVRLPEGAMLAKSDPAVSPRPDRLTTDGRTLTLAWEREGPLDLIVLYEQPSSAWIYITLAIILVIVVAAGVFVLTRARASKRAQHETLHETLGEDELLLVRLMREGVVNQKQLCERTGFSKSKMSKVVRKLEQKSVVTKTPHFKTNVLTLTQAWR